MRTLEASTRSNPRITCVACASHMHPEMVPWLQHAIGCPVRSGELSCYSAVAGTAAAVAHGRSLTPSSR